MRIEIEKKIGSIRVFNKDNKLLIEENSIRDRYKGGIRFNHGQDDQFYGVTGLGAYTRETGMLRNDGGRVEAGIQGDSGAPLIWSTSGYGILFDSIVKLTSTD